MLFSRGKLVKKIIFGFGFALISLWMLSKLPVGYNTKNQLLIDNAYVRAPIPGQDITAAFFTIVNYSEKSCTLLSAQSPSVQRIEFHTHKQVKTLLRALQDMVGMRQIDSVEVPAGTALSFLPGGLHLMLFGVQHLGDRDIQISIDTDQCGALSFAAPIKQVVAEHKGAMHH